MCLQLRIASRGKEKKRQKGKLEILVFCLYTLKLHEIHVPPSKELVQSAMARSTSQSDASPDLHKHNGEKETINFPALQWPLDQTSHGNWIFPCWIGFIT